MLNPELQQQSLENESRLLAQGRLGSSGGIGQTQGLMQAQNMTRLGLRRDSYNKSQQQLDAMRRRQQEDATFGMGIGSLASGYGQQSLNFANQRASNAFNAAQMRSGAALGRAGANAGMIGSALQGFNSQKGMKFTNPFGMFSKPMVAQPYINQYNFQNQMDGYGVGK